MRPPAGISEPASNVYRTPLPRDHPETLTASPVSVVRPEPAGELDHVLAAVAGFLVAPQRDVLAQGPQMLARPDERVSRRQETRGGHSPLEEVEGAPGELLVPEEGHAADDGACGDVRTDRAALVELQKAYSRLWTDFVAPVEEKA